MNFILFLTFIISITNATVIDLTSTNFQTVLDSHELVLVDFYASWCYFSNMLDPIFSDASNTIDAEFKDKGKVMLGKVDCESQSDLSKRFGIRKYPTIKLFRFGEVSKHEYRGARSGSAFVEYIRDQLMDPIKYVNVNETVNKEVGKIYVVGYFRDLTGANMILFRKVAHQLCDECKFMAKIIPDIAVEKLVIETNDQSGVEMEKLDDTETVKQWIIKSCTPVVRNITFQNAEDITEEGLPLVLLFYNPSHPDVTVRYSKFVADHLLPEKKSVNFVYADGVKFAHPLTHLGKSEHDLPLIAIDSFQHMFLVPQDIDLTLKDPQILKTHVSDLLSGKLHREFHNGPDPVATNVGQIEGKNVNGDSNDKQTTPIQSVFRKLKPNSNRYTLFHDEF